MSISYAKTVGLIKMPPTVEIGGRVYPLIKLGDYEIMIENVKDFGTVNTDYKNASNGQSYYNSSNLNSVFASQLNDGFTFATSTIYENIFNSLSGTDQEKSLKMMGYYSDSWPGNNQSGIDLKPWGYTNGNIVIIDSLGSILFLGIPSTYQLAHRITYNGTKLNFSTSGYAWGGGRWAPVRLARHV